MKCTIIVSEKRTDFKYSPVKKTSSSQEQENVTCLQGPDDSLF